MFIVASMFWIVMYLFGVGHSLESLLVIPAGILTGLAFATTIMAFTATRRNDSGFAAINRFVIIPLYLLGGTFFPIAILSGFFEPVLYLLGIGFGLGSLVPAVSTGGGHTVSYAMFVAPALMATSAMNGAVYESTSNFFYKLRYAKTFEAVIQTPVGVEDAALGEVIWAVMRGCLYSIGFVVIMEALGLIASPWGGMLSVLAALLIGFAFAALGTVITTFMRQWQDHEIVQLALQPMFLFSATFFPI